MPAPVVPRYLDSEAELESRAYEGDRIWAAVVFSELGGGGGGDGGGGGGGDGQTAAAFLLHTLQGELDHRGLADQVEAIRALLQSLRELVP